jgi:replicative DNA helicase
MTAADWTWQETQIGLRLLAGAIQDRSVARDLLATGAVADDFALPGLRAVFQAIELITGSGGSPTRAIIAARIHERIEGATDVLEALDTADPVRPGEDVATVLEHMRRRVATRRLADLGERLRRLDEWDDPTVAIAMAEQDLRNIGVSSAPVHGIGAMGLAEIGLAAASEPPVRIPTGFSAVDTALGGGLPCGYVSLFISGSGMGKTTFGRHAVLNALKAGVPTVLIGNESRRKETASSLIEMISGERVRSGASAEVMSRAATAAGELSSLPLWVEDSPVITAEDVASIIRTMRRRMGAQLFCIDYLQDMSMSHAFKRDDHLSHAHKSRILRTAAAEEDVAILALSQNASPAGDSKAPVDQEAVAGGRIYYRDAAAVVRFSRDAHSKSESKQHITHVKLSKNRHGAVKTEQWVRYDVSSRKLIECDAEGRDLDDGKDEEVIDAESW